MDNNNDNKAAADPKPQEEPQTGSNAAEQATQPTKPTVLRSHFKGMPKDWEKNKSTFIFRSLFSPFSSCCPHLLIGSPFTLPFFKKKVRARRLTRP